MGAAVALVAALAWATTIVLDVPGPLRLLSLALAEPSAVGTLFAVRAVPASSGPRQLPEQTMPWPPELLWKGQHLSVLAFLRQTGTRAFVVVHRGAVVAEWYDEATDVRTPLASWSVAKSILSLLVGQSIAVGHLHERDRLVDVLPALRDAGADPRITVRDLLDMTSGIDVPETYDAWRFWQGTTGMYLTRDLRLFVERHIGQQFALPGMQGVYRSIDTQLLGQVLATVERRPLASLLSDWLWTPLGAEQPASWNLDHAGGAEKAFCCINATARDFAKVGELILDNGRIGTRQIIPAPWIARLMAPAPLSVDGIGYSAQWWHPPGRDDDLSAIGVYGQYIYVDRRNDVVIVKLSGYGMEQDEFAIIDAFRALAAWWGGSPPAGSR